jgi:hypothetical protein
MDDNRPAPSNHEAPSMRLHRPLFLVSACLTLALAACQTAGGGSDAAPRPQATVVGSHLDDGNGRIDTFQVTEIAGRPVGRTDEPMKTLGVDAGYHVDAGRQVHLEIEGLTRYSNPAKTLFWDPHRVTGALDFVPAAQARYVVRGEIGPEGSTVWLEDDASHEVISRKFVAAPAGAASTPADRGL